MQDSQAIFQKAALEPALLHFSQDRCIFSSGAAANAVQQA
jgi:hypothetical protein